MELGAAGLTEQPFRTHGKPPVIVSYASQREALKVLEDTCATRNGLCLLQGPTLSGKSTLIRHFADSVPDERSVAVIDGDGLNTTTLVQAVLGHFGYVLDHSSTGELLAMLRVFALQQTAYHEPPILIIENAHALKPSALRALCELAELNVRRVSALKIVLVSDRSLLSTIEAPGMESLSDRLTYDFHLRPMTDSEAMDYLYAKLRAAGSDVPEFIFPESVCSELWRASGGWPGILDRVALLSLAKAGTLPVSLDKVERPVLPSGTWDDVGFAVAEREPGTPPGPPTLYVSHDGKTLQELTFDKSRMLIGRSEHNDIPIMSSFISRHHALLVRHGSSTILMDLNSTNGTFVNMKRVSNYVLIHNDIISIGHHRIKFIDPHATKHDSLQGVEFADTIVMKTLADMRNLLARENTEILPVVTENLPKSSA